MTPVQFSLFFVALVIGYLLVHLRLVKFETYLKEISGLKLLNERLQSVAEAMERINVQRLEEGLQLLHEDAKELGATAERIDRHLSSASAGGEPGRALASKGGSAAERICSAVEERLFELGYQKPRILTDLRHVHIEDEIEVQVECEKQMMPFKGRVKAKNGSVLDVDVHSVVGMFP